MLLSSFSNPSGLSPVVGSNLSKYWVLFQQTLKLSISAKDVANNASFVLTLKALLIHIDQARRNARGPTKAIRTSGFIGVRVERINSSVVGPIRPGSR